MLTIDLERFGPTATATARPPSPWKSRRYCRRLAKKHYENFSVLSRIVPRASRQHVANIYSYCRWADDLADETGDPERSLMLLGWWKRQLYDCYQGRAAHPVYIALSETIQKFNIPVEPFSNLLVAFRQDQRVTRYDTIEQLLEYCRYSANPVGRMVLYLAECHTEEREKLSDSICTGLQLANFCQDVARDWDRGRVYLPTSVCRRFGYEEAMFGRRECNEEFRQLMAAQVDQADGLLRAGWPLVAKMPPEWRLPIALFAAGGMAILHAIRRQNYDVWTRRPTVSRREKLQLMLRWWWRLRFSGSVELPPDE
jgi:squalene synthase HpnC